MKVELKGGCCTNYDDEVKIWTNDLELNGAVRIINKPTSDVLTLTHGKITKIVYYSECTDEEYNKQVIDIMSNSEGITVEFITSACTCYVDIQPDEDETIIDDITFEDVEFC